MNEIRTAAAARRALARLGNAGTARQAASYFKTGPGEYGEGDRFRGIRVPVLRKLAAACAGMPLGEVRRLVRSPFHEDRLLALIVLVRGFARGDERRRAQIIASYLGNVRYINNWDLVDSSAPGILGAYYAGRSRAPLRRMARSANLWERRMAMIATLHFIRAGEPEDALRLAELLLRDEHDLIHKAAGWMLREVGERCDRRVLRSFLDRHATAMPRTMLRYAIERLPAAERTRYLTMGKGRR